MYMVVDIIIHDRWLLLCRRRSRFFFFPPQFISFFLSATEKMPKQAKKDDKSKVATRCVCLPLFFLCPLSPSSPLSPFSTLSPFFDIVSLSVPHLCPTLTPFPQPPSPTRPTRCAPGFEWAPRSKLIEAIDTNDIDRLRRILSKATPQEATAALHHAIGQHSSAA